MNISNNIRLSAIAPQIMMKPYSHHAFYQKWTVAQSPAKHEQNKAFCIYGIVVLLEQINLLYSNENLLQV